MGYYPAVPELQLAKPVDAYNEGYRESLQNRLAIAGEKRKEIQLQSDLAERLRQAKIDQEEMILKQQEADRKKQAASDKRELDNITKTKEYQEAAREIVMGVNEDEPDNNKFQESVFRAMDQYGSLLHDQFGLDPDKTRQMVEGAFLRFGNRKALKELKVKEGYIKDRRDTTPATDIDDYVADDILARQGDKEAAARNAARLKMKRPQAEEVYGTTSAKGEAEIGYKPKLEYLTEKNKQLAQIETTPALLEAKGEITPVQKRNNAKKGVTGKLQPLAKHYLDLKEMGAIVDVEAGSIDNIVASLRSSTVGQATGRVFGTEAQSIRNKIINLQPLLLNDIRQASEMGARGLDSEKELEFYVQAATNPKRDFQANVAAMIVLDKTYGNGDIAKILSDLTDIDQVKKMLDEGQAIKLQYKDKSNWKLHIDSKGNKAYVSPDGTQFEEVP